jgi:transcriptional regulator with XRE-family HTH domain
VSTGAGTFAHLGDTIVVLRHLRGLSQAELAARAGIRPNQISRYETGQVLPQLGQLEKLLRALDVDLPELAFAMDHLARTARLLEEPERLPTEELLRHSVTAYWRHVSDLHLGIAAEVRRVVEERLGAGGPECDPR